MRAFFFLLGLLLQHDSYAQSDSLSFDLEPPGYIDSLEKKKLWATQYYIHQMNSGGNIPFLNKNGDTLGVFGDTCDFCTASLEGTAYVKDSTGAVTVLNYDGRGKSLVNCRQCSKYKNSTLNVESWGTVVWRKTTGFGDGVLNYRLIPFRTIAVDPAFIPYGSVIYIPKAHGAKIILPSGDTTTHDGYFFAGDTGGAIKKNHIDVFTGVYEGNPFPEIIYSNPKKTFECYIVSNTTIISGLKERHSKQ